MERWLSGRRRRTRNAVYSKGYRGFESHPLRTMNEPEHFLGCVAVKAIIEKSGKVLIVRDRKNADKWELPGGRVNCEEGVEQAFTREIEEELGIHVELGDFVHSEPRGSAPQRPAHLFIIFTARNIDEYGPLSVPSEEIGEARWIEKDEMDGIKFFGESEHALKRFWGEI